MNARPAVPDLAAYRNSQRPHSHDWQHLGTDHTGAALQRCDCGAARRLDDGGPDGPDDLAA